MLGGDAYRRAVAEAFADRPPVSVPETPSFKLSLERIEALGDALNSLPAEVVDAIDRGEPEWDVLGRLLRLPQGIGVLTAIALGLSDYRLGPGGAGVYWQVAGRELESDPPADPHGVSQLMARVMGHPVAALDADKKLSRIERLVSSPFPGRVRDRRIEDVGATLEDSWAALAADMRNPPHAKTIVFSIKLVDLMYLQATGRRARLPADMPIAVDIRVARASFASGILYDTAGTPVEVLMRQPTEVLLASRDPHVEAWNLVAGRTGLSPLRLDSLVWQAAAHLRPGLGAASARSSIAGLLVGYGAEPATATRVAAELTHALAAPG